jgi:predicted negative regulator of RcsB-dependent stress response
MQNPSHLKAFLKENVIGTIIVFILFIAGFVFLWTEYKTLTTERRDLASEKEIFWKEKSIQLTANNELKLKIDHSRHNSDCWATIEADVYCKN